jgi:hypothetical protein
MMMNISSGTKARFSNVLKQCQRIEQSVKTLQMIGQTVILPSVCDADTVNKPSIQFGNDYAQKRKAAVEEQARQRQSEQWAADLEKARQSEIDLGNKCQELLPILQSPALEAIGDVPAFSLGELLILLTNRLHPSFKKGPDFVLQGSEPTGFYFTKEFLRQEGFPETDIVELVRAAKQLVPLGLLTAVTARVEGQHQVEFIETRGFEVTVLGENIARKFKEVSATPQS